MGIYNEENIKKTIASTKFVLDESVYIFAKLNYEGLSPAKKIFSKSKDRLKMLSVDGSEITLILPQDEVSEELESYIIEHELVNPIYCNVDPDWPTCTGYLMKILEALSPENIGVYVVGAYRSDHILVNIEYAQKAFKILEELKEAA